MEKTKIIAIAIMFTIVLIVVLTSRFKMSKQYEASKLFRLFPFWIKYLGIVISVLSIVFHWSHLSDEPSVLGSFWQFGLLIGFLIICLSKERNEDEMTMSIRLNSIFISFFSGILAHVLIVLLGILDGGDVNSFNSLYVTNYVLFMYLIVFHLTKNRMR
jgi:hypothetical protein